MTNNLSNFSLFIPRKQNIVAPSADVLASSLSTPPIQGLGNPAAIAKTSSESGFNAAHLEQALRENFLAIQNWANRRGTSCSVRGSTNETIANNTITTLSFDSQTWDYYNIASTSAQTVTVPASGIYIVSGGVAFSGIPGQTLMQFYMVPGAYPAQTGFVSGSTNANWTMTFGGNAQHFVGGESLSVDVVATMPSATDTCKAILKEFTVTKLFDIPSKAQ